MSPISAASTSAHTASLRWCRFLLLLLFIGGCTGLTFKTDIMRSLTDVPMYGRVPSHDFTDTSTFSFPLKEQWDYDATGGFGPDPPIVVGTTLLFGILRGEFHAVDAVTGKRIGYFKTLSPIHASPALLGHSVVYGTESGEENLTAYRLADGAVAWTRDVGGVAASPVVRNDTLFVGGLDGRLHCMDQYGIEAWTFDTKEEIRSAPCLDGSVAFCASTNGSVYAVNTADGSLRWSFRTGSAVYAGLTVHHGMLIVASRDSSVTLLDASTGAVMRKIAVGNKVMAAPAAAESVLYVSSLDGSVGAYNMESGELLWKFFAKAVVNTTPVITPSAIFVASLDKNLYALSPTDGSVIWKHEFPARLKTTPLVWKNSIFIAAEDKTLYCFR